jgi:mono/diheme cytochrome c family protein
MSRWRPSLPGRSRLRLFGIDVLVMAGIAAVIAFAVIALGLFNVSARLGHLPPLGWAFHTTYENSVETWSAMDGVPSEKHPMPDLSQDFLIQRGAGHFQTTCFACHASPGRKRSLFARSMLPQPPHITEAVKGWADEQLYGILKQGVTMADMPRRTSR